MLILLRSSYLELKDVAATSGAVAPARRSLEARDGIATTAKNIASSAASLAVKGAVAVKDDIIQKGKDAFTGAHIQAYLVQKHADKLDNAVAIGEAAAPFAGPAGPALAAASTVGGAVSQIAHNVPKIPKPAIMKKHSPQPSSKKQKPAQPAGKGQRPKATRRKTI